ncbi:hypothetical protein ACO2Q1_10650 [Brevundimonas sp. VNH65]|uniref:hypothetical protein n=1 Tax=Brevundimonas sp. VNH65 TaxID=3400917 RepID=UPI003C092738
MMLSFLISVVIAATSSDPTAAFIGRWAVGPAEIEGYDTIIPDPPRCEGRSLVVIEAAGPGRIRRISRGREVEMYVRADGQDAIFSLTPNTDGYRVRHIRDGGFQMASAVGDAPDWGRSLQHNPCPAI